MIASDFPEANGTIKPPTGYAESQVMPLRIFMGEVERGAVEGAKICVSCWRPTVEELAALVSGAPLFISFLGGMPPHYPATNFHEATHPA